MLVSVNEEQGVEVEFDFQPGHPMTWDYPGDDPEYEILDAKWEDGTSLTEEEFDRLEETIIEALEEERRLLAEEDEIERGLAARGYDF
jgi:hypothetical protein